METLKLEYQYQLGKQNLHIWKEICKLYGEYNLPITHEENFTIKSPYSQNNE